MADMLTETKDSVTTKIEDKDTEEISRIYTAFERAEVRVKAGIDNRIAVVSILSDGQLRLLDVPENLEKPIDGHLRKVVTPDNIYTVMLMKYGDKKMELLEGERAEIGHTTNLGELFLGDASGFTSRIVELSKVEPLKVRWLERIPSTAFQEKEIIFDYIISGKGEEKFVLSSNVRKIGVPDTKGKKGDLIW